MTWRTRLLIAVGGTALLGLLIPAVAEPPQDPAPPQTAGEADVRVHHELVDARIAAAHHDVDPPPGAAPPRERVRRGSPDRSAGFVSRTGRLLLGDGRYRPEPFPRPNQ